MPKARPIPSAELCFRTYEVQMAVCDLCGTRAYTGPRCDLANVEVALKGKGWRVVQSGVLHSLQVCARCARKLGPNWVMLTAGSPADPAKK